MICVSIAENTVKKTLEAIKDFPFVEVYFDTIKDLTLDGIKEICSAHTNIIAKTQKYIPEVIEAGVSWIDIDEYKKISKKKTKIIISYHNYTETPENLEEIVEKGFNFGADAVKIACFVNSKNDNIKLLGLLEKYKSLIIIGMGVKGRITRLLSPLLGGLFTYASREEGKETAPGQLPYITMKEEMSCLENLQL